MTPTRRTVIGTVGSGLGLALAGCAGGTEETPEGPTETPAPSEPTPTDAETPTPTSGEPTPAATDTAAPTTGGTATPTATGTPEGRGAQAAYPDYDWAQLEGVDPVAAETITMGGFAFDPLVAAVEPGEIAVVNEDGAGHTITIPALGIDERVAGGSETTVAVDRTGTFDYLCRLHPPIMVGRLVVSES
jgi:plastocyanin